MNDEILVYCSVGRLAIVRQFFRLGNWRTPRYCRRWSQRENGPDTFRTIDPGIFAVVKYELSKGGPLVQ
jgi:hypothetical protein